MNWTAAKIARFVRETRTSDLPGDVVDQAKRMVLDTTGVTLRGVNSEAARIARSTSSCGGPARLPGTERRGEIGTVAYLTGIAAHVHDFDDVHQTMGGHPSAPVLAALVGLADAEGASGAELLRAFVVGTEIEARLGVALNPGHYERGWHPTGVLGTVGATLAAGALLDLDDGALRRATGLAASKAGGVKANFGTMTKSAHVGEAARAGVEAARLARRGFTANESALDADFGGFFDLFSGDRPASVREAFGDLGDRWIVADPPVWFKRYPCCGSTHAAIDAALDVQSAAPLAPEEVRSVSVVEHPRRLGHTDRPHPESVLDAKFSVQYCTAVALATGSVRLRDFTTEALERPAIRRLTDCVDAVADPDLVSHEWGARVVVEDGTGECRESTVPHPTGTGANPIPDDELHDKYRRCAGAVLADDAVESSLTAIRSLETVGDISYLVTLLTSVAE